jgi:hypothetical protein
VGDTDNQLLPSFVSVPVVKVICLAVRLESPKVCVPAAAPPVACVKIRPVGRTRGPGLLPAGRTFRITETNWGELFAVVDATWISPLYWPALRFEGFTETATSGTASELASVFPDNGVTESQLLPETVDDVTVHAIVPLPLFRIPKVCDGTTPPLTTAVNVSPV